ncbi:alpha/beta hydrolase [Paenibacillus sp. P25]|nr:alpha/beta hydrolase [Paenibacillus sp. P25]
MSAAVIYVSPVHFVQDLAERVRTRRWEHLTRVKRMPLQATLQFMRLARYARKLEPPRVAVPTLIVQGERDQIVHPRSAHYIYNKLKGERRLVLLPQSRHMICLDTEAEELFAQVARFLNEDKL